MDDAKRDDDELLAFQKEMRGVEPLPQSDKVDGKVKKVVTPGELIRRQDAVTGARRDGNPLADDHIPMIDPFETLSFRREGVQHGVFRKLKQGRYEIQSRLDLHRMTMAQARREVFDFIQEACRYDLRTVLIAHGKGERNKENPALLKSCTAHWLQELEDVQAYHSAQNHHGGVGAVYVMLRKSERLKQQNREQHGMRFDGES